MKILFLTHLFAPRRLSGSEIYAVELLKYLRSKGHETRVLLYPHEGYLPKKVYEYEGIEVFPMVNDGEHPVRRADILFTHLWATKIAMNLGKMYKKPVFHVTHSPQINEAIIKNYLPVNIIYNCETVKKQLKYPQPSIVVHPIIRKFAVDNPIENKYITLINLCEGKGGRIFYEIAKKLPNKQFLGVKGTYSDQIVEQLPNVTIIEPQTDIEKVYRQTRILLMPSSHESFGMTASEAMQCGIPVIANRTDGIFENCANAAIYCDRDNVDQWVKAILKLDKKKDYLSASESAKLQACAIDSNQELQELETFILNGAK